MYLAAALALGAFGAISLVGLGAMVISGTFSRFSGPVYIVSIASGVFRNLLLIGAGVSAAYLPEVAVLSAWLAVLVFIAGGIYMVGQTHGSVAPANLDPTFIVTSAVLATGAGILSLGAG